MTLTKKVYEADLPPGETLPEWAKRLIEAHNHNSDALAAVQGAQKPQIKDLSLLTAASPEDSFPMAVKLDFQPRLVRIGRVQNLTDPNAIGGDALHLDFVLVPSGISIRNIVGLQGSTQYVITIEAVP